MIEKSNLTISGYARWRAAQGLPGQSRRAVAKAIADGRISVDAMGRIPKAERADEEWARTTDPVAHERALGTSGGAGAELQRERGERLRWEAERARARALRELRSVVDVDAFNERLRPFHAEFRRRFSALPKRIAPRLVDLSSDVRAITQVLTDEIHRELAALSKWKHH